MNPKINLYAAVLCFICMLVGFRINDISLAFFNMICVGLNATIYLTRSDK